MKRVLATLYILGLTMVMFAFTMLIPLVVAYVGRTRRATPSCTVSCCRSASAVGWRC